MQSVRQSLPNGSRRREGVTRQVHMAQSGLRRCLYTTASTEPQPPSQEGALGSPNSSKTRPGKEGPTTWARPIPEPALSVGRAA
jgi:hypothetical protein